MRQRARIVRMAADGVATRAIGRTVGCTTGTASKWRVRYAEQRLAGLGETGDRGAEPKYTVTTDKRTCPWPHVSCAEKVKGASKNDAFSM